MSSDDRAHHPDLGPQGGWPISEVLAHDAHRRRWEAREALNEMYKLACVKFFEAHLCNTLGTAQDPTIDFMTAAMDARTKLKKFDDENRL